MEYQDAVRTLNTLQTNAGYLEQVKRQRGDPQTQLEAMKLYLARSGLQVEDLDQLNIIHVTGTKGKVRDGTQEQDSHLMVWEGETCQTRPVLSRAPLVPSRNVFSEATA